MSYSVATHFDQSSWDKYGANWLRKAKSERLKGFVIGHNLNDETQTKISDAGFGCHPKRASFQLADLCGDRCLLTRFDSLPKGGLPEGNEVVGFIDPNMDVIDLVWSMSNLHNRAKAARFLQERIKTVHDGFFSTRYILGSKKFWADLAAFEGFISQQRQAQNSYLEGIAMRDELVLNLYLAFFNSTKIGIENED